MSGQDTVFTGRIPRLYDRHLGASVFEPYARDIVRRLGGLTEGRLLETAAGTGIVTQALASSLPISVEIVATDLNAPMVEYAKTKPGMERIDCKTADALSLPFPDSSFDGVVCQFGIMFFPDRVQGMREALRVLRPGGRFIFSVWESIGDNPAMDATVNGLKRHYPSHPSWFLERTPCGYHDPDRIRHDLASAGFGPASIDLVREVARFDSALSVATGFCQGSPLRTEIESLDPNGLETATQAAAAAIVERFGDGTIEASMVALVVETEKPA